MLPMWGLWSVCPGKCSGAPVLPGPYGTLLKKLLYVKDMGIFPLIFLMMWLVKWPILQSETEFILFLWILRPSIGAEFLVLELPIFWGRSSIAPQRWELIFISWMMIQMAVGDCRNHSSLTKVYKSEIIRIWSFPSTLILIFNSFSLLAKLCSKVVASSRIWINCPCATDSFLKYCGEK